MSKILLTGASGFLGTDLLNRLSSRHEIITIGRKPMPAGLGQFHYLGNFADFEDLRQLNTHEIDIAIHLAAVTGGCLEREGILVNVEGTRCLMRYLIDRGCRKFVNASSTAVVGFQSMDFRPLQLPIPDEHPCLDHFGYGLSKYLMEEVSRYLSRQNPQIDVVDLRLAAIYPDENPPPRVSVGKLSSWAVGQITQLPRSEAVRAFVLAAEAPTKPGHRILNVVSPRAWVAQPTRQILRSWWGEDFDLSYFDRPGVHPEASLFTRDAMSKAFGFEAK